MILRDRVGQGITPGCIVAFTLSASVNLFLGVVRAANDAEFVEVVEVAQVLTKSARNLRRIPPARCLVLPMNSLSPALRQLFGSLENPT